MKKLSNEMQFISEIFNYSCKGIVAGLGKGEGITKEIKLLSLRIDKDSTFTDLSAYLKYTKLVEDGDIIVVPSKIVSIIEKRYVYNLTIENYKQCVTDLTYARKNLKTNDDSEITEKDIIGMDKIDPDEKIGVIYPKNPNFSAYMITQTFQEQTGLSIDVVITDSDSGAKKGIALIGCPTIINTPIAATLGIGLFYAMRVAVAAEINWNNTKNSPILLVKPYQASRIRDKIGQFRYDGFINAVEENDYKKFID